jgi:hypothetical protein
MLWHLNRLRDCDDSYLTCFRRDDGAGAQISARVSTMLFARLTGARYAHTPLRAVAHAPAGMTAEAWGEAWESFFNLGADHPRADDLIAAGYASRHLRKPQRSLLSRRTVHDVPHCHKITDRHPAAWAALAPELRRAYDSTPKPRLEGFCNGELNVALHVRRGDVSVAGAFAERFTSNEEILAFHDALLARLKAVSKVRVRLFSEGDPDDYREFARRGIELHLNEDAFTTFHHLVMADVLLVAKSSFIYLAGVLGGGICFIDRLGHPPLPSWFRFGSVIPAVFDSSVRGRVVSG